MNGMDISGAMYHTVLPEFFDIAKSGVGLVKVMGRSTAETAASAAATPAESFVAPLLADEELDGDEEQAASITITDSEQVRLTSRAARPGKNLFLSM
ncbi:MAG: hypothetical protein ACRDPY_36995 [Streptosporangiaceae bacterium]